MAARTYVGFSSTDIRSFYLMQAWKANTNIDFDFINCQLATEVDSDNEQYVKRRLRERINMAGTFALLIGQDTRFKHRYVRWEVEVAIEKECRLIAINLDGYRLKNTATCPTFIDNVGAMFVPFSPKIVNYALDHFRRETTDNWSYKPHVYTALGY